MGGVQWSVGRSIGGGVDWLIIHGIFDYKADGVYAVIYFIAGFDVTGYVDILRGSLRHRSAAAPGSVLSRWGAHSKPIGSMSSRCCKLGIGIHWVQCRLFSLLHV